MGCRSGWKGRPVVVLGRREGVPMGLHPLVSFVARPVKHVRLATALLKASALMRSKSQVRALCAEAILIISLTSKLSTCHWNLSCSRQACPCAHGHAKYAA